MTPATWISASFTHRQAYHKTSSTKQWQSATVVNSTLVVDPTIRLPGFDLHRRQWSLLNRFRTGQGHCNACHNNWGFTDNELWLWRHPDNVTHRQLLSIDQIWRRSTALTWSRWGCRQLADNIWLLEHDNNNNRRSSVDQWIKCIWESVRTSLSTSAKQKCLFFWSHHPTKLALLRATDSVPWKICYTINIFPSLLLKRNKVSKSEGTRKVE